MADFSFEEASSQDFSFEDAQPKKTPKSYAGRVLAELPGALEGSARMIAQVPSFIAGGLRGVVDQALTGDSDVAKAGAQASADLVDPNRLMPDTSGRTANFQEVMGSAMEGAKEIGKSIIMHDRDPNDIIGENLGEAIGDFGGQMGAMSFVPGAKPLARVLERPFEARKARIAKEKFQKEQKIGAFTWDELIKDQEQQVQARAQDRSMLNKDAQRVDEGNIPDQNIKTPYNLDPAEKARLEAELNPPVDAQRTGAQGELFTDERAYNPEEMQQRRFVTSDEGVGARDQARPVEKELGATVHTADVIDGAREAAGPEGFRYESGDPYKKALDPNRPNRENRRAALTDEVNKDRPSEPFYGPKVESQITLGRRQRGVIDPELLTFGTSRIWEGLRERYPDTKEAVTKLLEKFKGTFDPITMDHAIQNSLNPKSKSTVVLMSPDDFHRLATKRDFSVDDRVGRQNYFEGKRIQVREALKTKRGLFDIPELQIRNGEVVAHEGRHRMDVFKEQGMDLVPVVLKDDFRSWGEKSAPSQLMGQNGDIVPMPKSLTFPTPDRQVSARPQVPLSQRGAIGDWSKRMDKEKVAALAIEARKQFQSTYGKPLSEMFKDQPLDPKTIQDFGSELETLGGRAANVKDTFLTHFNVDRAMSILAAKKTGLGRLVKWTVDNRTGITQVKDVAVRDGVEALIGHLKTHTVKDYLSSAGRARIAEHNRNVKEMFGVWTNNIGGKRLEIGDFNNPKQYDMFKKSRDFLNAQLDKVNKARDLYGHGDLKRIQHIENYLPAIWEGDYRIWIKNQAGVNKGVFGFKSIWQANHAYKELVKAHPDLVVESPSHRKIEKGDIDARVLKDAGRQKAINYALSHDLSGFEEALKVMTANDPVTKAVQATYAKLITTKGFNTSLLSRKNLFGYLGFTKDGIDSRNMTRAMEMWVKRSENHIANLRMMDVKRQLAELPMEIRQKIPHGLDYLEDYLDISRGANKDQMPLVEAIVGGMSRNWTGMGFSGAERSIKSVSSLASMAMLLRVPFVISNLTQHLNIMPKVIDLWQIDKQMRNPIDSYWNGMLHAYSPKGIREKVAQEWVEWAGKNGHLESSIVSMLDMKLTDIGSEKGNIIMDTGRYALGHMEKATVRTQAGLIAEYSLRDSVPDKIQRFEEAAQMMNHYMVAYDQASKPMVYNKAGPIIGGLLSPLKQYAHNNFGQFFEYMQTAKDQHRYAPLASYIGIQALTAGLKGTILVSEAAAIIAMINMKWNTDIPTPEEWMIKSGFHDSLISGGFSYLLGADVSSSMNAPNLPQMLQLAPQKFTANAVDTAFTYFSHKIKGTDTQQDLMAMALANSPLAMRGWVEEYFREPGGVVPNPNRRMQGDYRRSDNYFEDPTTNKNGLFNPLGEKSLALLSMKSMSESKANVIGRLARQEFGKEAEMRLEALDAIADRVMNREPLDADLINRYIKEGGDPRNLAQSLKERIKLKALTFEEQQYAKGGSMTMQKADHLQRMKKYLDSKSGDGGGGGGIPEINPESQDRVDLLNKSTDTRMMARIRAQEANGEPEKIQEKIDGYQKRLDASGTKKLEGDARHMIRQEKKAWEDAKKYIQKQGSGNDTDGNNPWGSRQSPPNKSFEDWYSIQSETDKKLIREHLKSQGVVLPSETQGSTGKRFIQAPRQRPIGMRGI